LYLVPTVNNFGDGAKEFAMTKETDSGTTTLVAFCTGLNSMSLD
jgi:hypothetical protein